jgi:hypothetical protein
MKNRTKNINRTFLRKLILSVLAVVFSMLTNAQSLTFNVTTVTYDGQYTPYNCFVVWITKANGAYVKTINRQSSTYTYYLTTWRVNSGAKITDGQTGATLTRHNEPYFDEGVMRIPFNWNCKDFNNILVPDGDYYVNVEFTENDATGKYMKYLFTKGAESKTINYPNVNSDPGVYFRNAVLNYFAPSTEIPILGLEDDIKVFFNSENKSLLLNYNGLQARTIKMSLIDVKGMLRFTKDLSFSPCILKLTDLSKGVYILRLVDENKMFYTRKILIK